MQDFMQEESADCSALQNVVDVFLDSKGILWVLDTGIVNTLDQPENRCPSKVVAIDAKSGSVLKVIDVSYMMCPMSRIQYLVVDYTLDNRIFLYVSDAANRAILVFDVSADQGYRLILPQVVSMGSKNRDVLYMTLIRKHNNDNMLVFSYLGSLRIYGLRTVFAQTGTGQGRIRELGVKPEKLIFLGTDHVNNLFFRKEGRPDIFRWDMQTGPNLENMKLVHKRAIGSNGLATQVVPDYKHSRMRVLESNFPDFFRGTVGSGVNQSFYLI